jgi:GNAT superfamily N-acetyltransferase
MRRIGKNEARKMAMASLHPARLAVVPSHRGRGVGREGSEALGPKNAAVNFCRLRF